jgi:hypothetical protein
MKKAPQKKSKKAKKPKKKRAKKPARRRAPRIKPIVGPFQIELPLQMPLFPATSSTPPTPASAPGQGTVSQPEPAT